MQLNSKILVPDWCNAIRGIFNIHIDTHFDITYSDGYVTVELNSITHPIGFVGDIANILAPKDAPNEVD